MAFRIKLASKDVNRTVVQNLGRAIVKKMVIKISGNEVMSIDDSDVFYCYNELWRTASERQNAYYQGIDTSQEQNVTKLRIGAENGNREERGDLAVANHYGNRFCIPLDFELLTGHMPLYQSALGDRLEYELTFNDYSRVIKAEGDTAASYSIENISL